MTGHFIETLNAWSAAWAPVIWRASWQGGLFVVAIWAVCKALPSVPASTRAWLWWVASAQLVIRFVVVTPIAVPVIPVADAPRAINPLGGTRPAPAEAATHRGLSGNRIGFAGRMPALPGAASLQAPGAANRGLSGSRIGFAGRMPALPGAAPLQAPGPRPSGRSLLVAAWVFGLIAGASVSLRRLARSRRLVRGGELIEAGTAFDLVAELCAAHRVRRPRLMESTQATCALLTGWRSPVIVLPQGLADSAGESHLRMVLAHEIAHIRRHDLWLGVLPVVTQTLFFFHPLAWLAGYEGAAARESACDLDALRMSGESPAAYARLLVERRSGTLQHGRSGRRPRLSIHPKENLDA